MALTLFLSDIRPSISVLTLQNTYLGGVVSATPFYDEWKVMEERYLRLFVGLDPNSLPSSGKYDHYFHGRVLRKTQGSEEPQNLLRQAVQFT